MKQFFFQPACLHFYFFTLDAAILYNVPLKMKAAVAFE